MIRKFAAWFTSERRQRIQVALGALAPLLILLGLGTDSQWEQFLIIGGAVLQFVSALLALVNVRVADWATQGWAIVRGAVYALAATVAPALVLLGVLPEETANSWMLGLSLGLTALSSALAIFAGGEQATVAKVQEGRDRAVVGALTADISGQVASLEAAAQRLGIPSEEITREIFREGLQDGS